jgi:hypothetical protein
MLSGATGAFGNLTVTNTQRGGDLILWSHGAPQPLSSKINYVAGQTVANAVNVGRSSDGRMDLFVHVLSHFRHAQSGARFGNSEC